MTRCRCVGTRHTCGIQNTSPNVVVVGQGGPRGLQGAQGRTGATGADGTSVTILGSYNTYAELVAAHPTGSLNDGYLIAGDLYIWEGSSWINVGNISGPQGVQGIAGTQGIQGIQGVQGTGVSLQDVTDAIAGAALGSTDDLSEGTNNKYFTVGRVSYIHDQGTPEKDWVIVHNLGFYPNLTVKDSSGTIYEGEIDYINSDSLTVSFSAAFSGTAYLS